MRLKQSIDKKIKNSKEVRFSCPKCNKEFDQMEIYKRDYKCPFDETSLEKKKSTCNNPEKLRKESNKIFTTFEGSLKILEDYKIPREFFGFEPFNKPNFNLPNNITFHGFKNNFSNMKINPTVKVQFNTLKSDIYRDSNCFNDQSIGEAQEKERGLFDFYLDMTKSHLIQRVKSASKKVNRRKNKTEIEQFGQVNRKKKEEFKKLQESQEYDQMYKSYWSKIRDI